MSRTPEAAPTGPNMDPLADPSQRAIDDALDLAGLSFNDPTNPTGLNSSVDVAPSTDEASPEAARQPVNSRRHRAARMLGNAAGRATGFGRLYGTDLATPSATDTSTDADSTPVAASTDTAPDAAATTSDIDPADLDAATPASGEAPDSVVSEAEPTSEGARSFLQGWSDRVNNGRSVMRQRQIASLNGGLSDAERAHIESRPDYADRSSNLSGRQYRRWVMGELAGADLSGAVSAADSTPVAITESVTTVSDTAAVNGEATTRGVTETLDDFIERLTDDEISLLNARLVNNPDLKARLEDSAKDADADQSKIDIERLEWLKKQFADDRHDVFNEVLQREPVTLENSVIKEQDGAAQERSPNRSQIRQARQARIEKLQADLALYRVTPDGRLRIGGKFASSKTRDALQAELDDLQLQNERSLRLSSRMHEARDALRGRVIGAHARLFGVRTDRENQPRGERRHILDRRVTQVALVAGGIAVGFAGLYFATRGIEFNGGSDSAAEVAGSMPRPGSVNSLIELGTPKAPGSGTGIGAAIQEAGIGTGNTTVVKAIEGAGFMEDLTSGLGLSDTKAANAINDLRDGGFFDGRIPGVVQNAAGELIVFKNGSDNAGNLVLPQEAMDIINSAKAA